MAGEDSGWARVAALADLEEGQPFAATLDGLPIVLVVHEAVVHALEGVCPHAYALMAEGFLNGAEIECPLHAACFEIATGKCVSGPAGTRDLKVLDVRVEADDVLVRPRAGNDTPPARPWPLG